LASLRTWGVDWEGLHFFDKLVPNNMIIKDFLLQSSANLTGTIAGGLILYYFLNKRISDKIRKENDNRLLKNLGWDLGFNWVKANKISEKKEFYRKTDEFTSNKYRTQNLMEFLAQRPISEDEKFPYVKLLALVDKFEQDNSLKDMVFEARDPNALQKNKNKYLDNVENRKKEIS